MTPGELYREFTADLSKAFEFHEYGFSPGKRKSCDWIVPRVPEGRGVDVGGTYYLVEQLRAAGRDTTFYDYFPPTQPGMEPAIADDMANFGLHFAPRSLDFITCRHTLEHSLNPTFQLWQFNRALKDDGRLIVIVPIHNRNWTWFYTHFSCLPLENWQMLFHRTGFGIVESAAGTWKANDPNFVEYRFVLGIESRAIRLRNK